MGDVFQKDYWERKSLNKRRTPEHPVIQSYVKSRIKEISKSIEFSPALSLLDVGCGNGFFMYQFNNFCQVTGVDYSEQMLKLNPVKNVLQMDAHELKFQNDSFDLVFCHALLHHVAFPEKVISEMAKVSRKYVVIMEPNRSNPLMFLFGLLVKEERKSLQFSLAYLTNMARQSGLRIKDAFSFGLAVPNRTPVFLLPLTRLFDRRFSLGVTNVIIAEKLS